MTIPKILLVVFLIFGPTIALLGYLGYLYPPYVNEKAPSEAVSNQYTFDNLLDAIEWVESRGDANAVGDNGNAVGSFQIHKIYVDDVNRICKLYGYYQPVGHYVYKDRWDRNCSRFMVEIYLKHYYQQVKLCDAIDGIIDGNLTPYEIAARIHNGGGDGWRNDPHWFVRNRNYTLEKAKKKIANAKKYWLKIKQALEGR